MRACVRHAMRSLAIVTVYFHYKAASFRLVARNTCTFNKLLLIIFGRDQQNLVLPSLRSCAASAGARKACAASQGARKARAVCLRLRKACAARLGARRACAAHLGSRKACAAFLGPWKACTARLGARKTCAARLGAGGWRNTSYM